MLAEAKSSGRSPSSMPFLEQSARAEAGLHCGLVLGRVIRCQLAKRRLEAARCRQRHRLRRRRDGAKTAAVAAQASNFALLFTNTSSSWICDGAARWGCRTVRARRTRAAREHKQDASLCPLASRGLSYPIAATPSPHCLQAPRGCIATHRGQPSRPQGSTRVSSASRARAQSGSSAWGCAFTHSSSARRAAIRSPRPSCARMRTRPQPGSRMPRRGVRPLRRGRLWRLRLERRGTLVHERGRRRVAQGAERGFRGGSRAAARRRPQPAGRRRGSRGRRPRSGLSGLHACGLALALGVRAWCRTKFRRRRRRVRGGPGSRRFGRRRLEAGGRGALDGVVFRLHRRGRRPARARASSAAAPPRSGTSP